MLTPRCCRHPSVTRTPPHPSITPVDAVSGDPRLGSPDLWPRPDGRVEVRAGARLTPATLVPWASACYALRQAGYHPVLRVEDAVVRDYLWRCAFLAAVHPVATVEPPLIMAPGGARGPRASPLLLDVTRLTTSADLPAVLDQILGVLRLRLGYRPDNAGDVTTAVSELGQNIFDHNAQPCGCVALQVAGRRGHRHLAVGVADDGAGLAATLRRNPDHPPLRSDGAAIRLAVQRGTSASGEPTRGHGLAHVLALVARQAGTVQIRSGTAAVRYARERQWTGTVPWMAGVHVALTLPTPSRVDS
jgi:anti-sigma regulatory factor (Ser/Thr protein kinase)